MGVGPYHTEIQWMLFSHVIFFILNDVKYVNLGLKY
jgi:hypothetical protein